MFRVYKPKGERIKAVQLNDESIDWFVKEFRGRVAYGPNMSGGRTAEGVDIPSFEGAVHIRMNDYLVPKDGGGFNIVDCAVFEEGYELAKNMTRGE